jgi:hypothetical protein
MPDDIEHLSIRKFNIKEMAINSKVVIIGKPATGKSTLIKDLLYQHHNKFTNGGIIMSGKNVSPPDLFIYEGYGGYGGYNQDVIDKFMTRQKLLVLQKSMLRSEVRQNGLSHPDNLAFLVNDDCIYDKSWVKNGTTQTLFKNGRSLEMFFMLSMTMAMEFSLNIPPELRTCIDYIFIMTQSMLLEDRIRIFERYGNIFPNFQMFCDVLDNLTEDYHCMVIKNRVTSSKLEDCVFWYKAQVHDKPFKVGTPGLWKYHHDHYNEDYDAEEEAAAMKREKQKKYGRGKKNTTFVVNKVY